VLGRPDRVEAELLGRLGHSADPFGRGALAEVRQDEAEMHDSIVLRRRIADSRVARLATVDADGRPHLVPIVFVLAGDTLYSAVDAKPKRSRKLRRIENARRRPDVTVLIDHYDEDWTRLWWVRLRGEARVLDGGEEAANALVLLAAKYEQYRKAAPGLPVLAIDIAELRAWRADE
jgi:PPOX class probable F420-dependent enzyme